MTELWSEAEFTRPRPDCPHPEYWHAPDAYATEAEVTDLVAAMVVALQPEFVVETGTHTGTTALAIGRALARNGHGRLVTIEREPLKAIQVGEFIARESVDTAAGPVPLPVTVVAGDSLAYVPDQPIDFAFMDSAIDARVPEYRRFLPHLSPRAVVMFHDTGPHHALAPQLDQVGDLDLIYLPTPRGVAIGRPRP